jgi:hypothetical protein
VPAYEPIPQLQFFHIGIGNYLVRGPGVFVIATRKALRTLVGIENLEQRWDREGDLIDRDVLEYLRYHYLDL